MNKTACERRVKIGTDEWLVLQPFMKQNVGKFAEIVNANPYVQERFRFGDVNDFYESLEKCDCWPYLIYLKEDDPSSSIGYTSNLIGYINAYAYSNDEALVEFFISKEYRGNDYSTIAIKEFYLSSNDSFPYKTLRFDVEAGDFELEKELIKLGEIRINSFFFDKEGRCFLEYRYLGQ